MKINVVKAAFLDWFERQNGKFRLIRYITGKPGIPAIKYVVKLELWKGEIITNTTYSLN